MSASQRGPVVTREDILDLIAGHTREVVPGLGPTNIGELADLFLKKLNGN